MKTASPPVSVAKGTAGWAEASERAVPLALVVDDSAVNRTLLRSLLVNRGYDVVEAEDGLDAVEVFRAERPDIVFMDVLMPRMDGFESTRRIRAEAGDRYIPVIFLTSLSSHDGLQQCVEAGGDEFFSKPFDARELDARLTVIERLRVIHETMRLQRNELLLHREHEDRERRVAEQLMARAVRPCDVSPELFDFRLLPASLFSGDVVLVTRTPEGRLRALVGDVTGHGLPASVAGMVAANAFYETAQRGERLATTLRRLNDKLHAVLPDGVFLAAALIEYDALRGALNWWSGGLPPIAVRRGNGGGVELLEPFRPPLGILDPDGFRSGFKEILLAPGDEVVIYSDGLVEQENKAGEPYGETRLLRRLSAPSGGSLEGILGHLQDFSGSAERSDDVTIARLRVPEAASTEHDPDWSRPTGWWAHVFRLGGDALRSLDLAASLGPLLANAGFDEAIRERALTVATELVTNSLDHGVLGLSSEIKSTPEGMLEYMSAREAGLDSLGYGWVELQVSYDGSGDTCVLIIRTEDSGDPWEAPQIGAGTDQLHGRGLTIVRELCSSLEIGPDGAFVEGRLEW